MLHMKAKINKIKYKYVVKCNFYFLFSFNFKKLVFLAEEFVICTTVKECSPPFLQQRIRLMIKIYKLTRAQILRFTYGKVWILCV